MYGDFLEYIFSWVHDLLGHRYHDFNAAGFLQTWGLILNCILRPRHTFQTGMNDVDSTYYEKFYKLNLTEIQKKNPLYFI